MSGWTDKITTLIAVVPNKTALLALDYARCAFPSSFLPFLLLVTISESHSNGKNSPFNHPKLRIRYEAFRGYLSSQHHTAPTKQVAPSPLRIRTRTDRGVPTRGLPEHHRPAAKLARPRDHARRKVPPNAALMTKAGLRLRRACCLQSARAEAKTF